jgi:RHS repeat-associated protein
MMNGWLFRRVVGLLPFIALLFFHSAQANGNVLATGGKTFTYDSQNQMITMAASGTAVTMTYDGFGNRVAKTVNGVATRYLVEDDKNPTGYPQVFDELNGAGQVTRTYTYGLQRIDEEQVLNGAWTPSFYGYDGGGNVRQLTNSSGAVTDSYEYDAFGNSFTVSGTTPNNYLYRGEQYDSDLGLYYLRARYYNPNTGRFMSRDPEDHPLTDIKELHRYLYAGGNPVNAVDPTGKGWEDLMAQLDAALDVAADRLTGKAVAKVLACVAATILGKVVGGEGIAGDAGGGLLGGLCAVILGGGGGG